jgi:LacI family transcriptional regulator
MSASGGRRRVRRRKRPVVVLSLPPAGELVEAALSRGRRAGWDIHSLHFTDDTLPTGLAPDGAIVGGVDTEQTLLQRLCALRCPTVRVGHAPGPEGDVVPAVFEDVAGLGRIAAEHFAERGFRHVGYIGHTPWASARLLYEAFEARAGELGCRCHLLRIRSAAVKRTSKPAAVYEKHARRIGEWLAGVPRPIGVLGYHDRMAGMLCAVCRAEGLAVPEDVAVLGRGNDRASCELAPVPLSSTDPNHAEQGRQAVRLLKRLMAGKPVPPSPIVVPPLGVAARRSTDVLAVPDRAAARAMRFLWDHLDQPLSVDDIAREAKVSRRVLERAFRQHLGRGVAAELRRKRLERCCELLVTTERTIADIARSVGFECPRYLYEVFRKARNMTPRQYRLRHGERDNAGAGKGD